MLTIYHLTCEKGVNRIKAALRKCKVFHVQEKIKKSLLDAGSESGIILNFYHGRDEGDDEWRLYSGSRRLNRDNRTGQFSQCVLAPAVIGQIAAFE